jgi:hypothetical protein
MKYTYEEMMQYYKIYLSKQCDTLTNFINRMKSFDMSEEDSTIMWKAFDMATEKCLAYGNIINMIKEMNIND